MVNDPRPPKPRAPAPQPPRDPLDLLRELARDRAPISHELPDELPHDQAEPDPAAPSEKLHSLRSLAETLNRQLRTPPGAAPQPPQDQFQSPPPDPYDQYDPYEGAHQAPPQRPSRPRVAHRGAPRTRSAAWLLAAQAEWAAFYAGLPPARALVPRIRLPEIVFVAIAAVVLLAAAIGSYIEHRRPALVPGTNEPVVPAFPSPFPTPGAPSSTQEPAMPTVADIKTEMSACDAAAAQDADSLYFLVLPLQRTDPADAAWNPVPLQTIGSDYVLLGASDALDGLRDGKLKVRDGRYTFAVLDTLSGTTYSWTSATRLSRLARKDPSGVKTLKLGFDFSPTQIGPQWSAEFKRDRGTCYWVSVLVR
jgi:hypothetical protein